MLFQNESRFVSVKNVTQKAERSVCCEVSVEILQCPAGFGSIWMTFLFGENLTRVFPFSAALYFYSTTFQREMFYFLPHYIYLTALVTSYFTDFTYKRCDDLLIYNGHL